MGGALQCLETRDMGRKNMGVLPLRWFIEHGFMLEMEYVTGQCYAQRSRV